MLSLLELKETWKFNTVFISVLEYFSVFHVFFIDTVLTIHSIVRTSSVIINTKFR